MIQLMELSKARAYFQAAFQKRNPTIIFLGNSSDQANNTSPFLHFKLISHDLDYLRVMRFSSYYDAPPLILKGFGISQLPAIVSTFPKNALGE